ncbi:MAG TPA: flagellin FliC [Gammaproteobacteria bacterium]|nr:flagellin FliC [Gammaproteobacteria bacterium]
MSLVVNTNVASMNAQRSLMSSSRELQTAMERLSTGKKINSAADDAAGFAIAESMTAQVRGLSMAAKNAGDGLSLLKVVENATNDVTDMLQRIRELSVQAKSGTNSDTDVGNLQAEAEALMDEITRVATDTTYNGVAYLSNVDADGNAEAERTVSIQVGYNDGDSISVKSYAIDAATLDLTDAAGDGTTYKTSANGGYLNINSATALDTISDAIDSIAGHKAEWGAGQNRLEYTISNLMNVVEFTTAARSRIEDADFAVEAARLAKAQVLQQTGTAMLAQANASPQLAISLLS